MRLNGQQRSICYRRRGRDIQTSQLC